ncbi:MAG TPA: hypothetical protein VFV86_05980, partial [Nitrososphaeraceae archaeon]|nr:hypothetical protein [Nitrososphaeraceae archaeon]
YSKNIYIKLKNLSATQGYYDIRYILRTTRKKELNIDSFISLYMYINYLSSTSLYSCSNPSLSISSSFRLKTGFKPENIAGSFIKSIR